MTRKALTKLYPAVGDYLDFDAPGGGAGWTENLQNGAINWNQTVAPILGAASAEFNWTDYSSSPDSRLYAFTDIVEEPPGIDYFRMQVAVHVDSSFTLGNLQTMELVALHADTFTRCYIYFTASGGQYFFSLQQVSPNIQDAAVVGTALKGTDYFFEIRSFADQSTGGLEFDVFSDPYFSVPVGVSLSTKGSGWSQDTHIDRIRLGTVASSDKQVGGKIRFDRIRCDGVTLVENRPSTSSMLRLLRNG